jgi:sulfatase maturation enzyme AslB (radical SAM superfamily)
MKIQIDPHTQERAEERGANREEIIDVLENGFEIEAKRQRLGKAQVADFHQPWRNRVYDQERVEVFYQVEGDVIITVTVYVFYGKWEVRDAGTL